MMEIIEALQKIHNLEKRLNLLQNEVTIIQEDYKIVKDFMSGQLDEATVRNHVANVAEKCYAETLGLIGEFYLNLAEKDVTTIDENFLKTDETALALDKIGFNVKDSVSSTVKKLFYFSNSAIEIDESRIGIKYTVAGQSSSTKYDTLLSAKNKDDEFLKDFFSKYSKQTAEVINIAKVKAISLRSDEIKAGKLRPVIESGFRDYGRSFLDKVMIYLDQAVERDKMTAPAVNSILQAYAR